MLDRSTDRLVSLSCPLERSQRAYEVRVSPRPSGALKPATEHGATLTFTVPNPDSRLGQSPHLQGRAMDEQPIIFVGIDVSRDRLDVHLRPSDEAFHVPRSTKELDALARRLSSLPVALIVLEATGGRGAFSAIGGDEPMRPSRSEGRPERPRKPPRAATRARSLRPIPRWPPMPVSPAGECDNPNLHRWDILTWRLQSLFAEDLLWN